MTEENENEDFFEIVEFVNERCRDGKKCLEISGRTWIVNRVGQRASCYFPPLKDYGKLDEWLKEKAGPVSTWERFDVEILGSAATYKKAQKKLKHFYKSLSDLETTDAEGEDTQVSKISKKRAQAMLNVVYPLENINEESQDEATADNDVQKKTQTAVVLQGPAQDPPRVSRSTNDKRLAPAKPDKKAELEARVLELREEAGDDHLKQFIVDYFDATLSLTLHKIRNDLESLKRSSNYDLKKTKDELKESFAVRPFAQNDSNIKLVEKLGTALPIKNAIDFDTWEKSLNPEENAENAAAAIEKLKILKQFMSIETSGSTDHAADIKTILSLLIAKAVQLEHSGAGRKVHGMGKKNFSATWTYKCMNDDKQYLEKMDFSPGGTKLPTRGRLLKNKNKNFYSKLLSAKTLSDDDNECGDDGDREDDTEEASIRSAESAAEDDDEIGEIAERGEEREDDVPEKKQKRHERLAQIYDISEGESEDELGHGELSPCMEGFFGELPQSSDWSVQTDEVELLDGSRQGLVKCS
nr:PREDICTED: uncharacterized protein LOC105272447 [Fopius arisanus]